MSYISLIGDHTYPVGGTPLLGGGGPAGGPGRAQARAG
jgi:hypothetical protein